MRPRSTAFLASSAAPIITYGLDVLVQEVMAATATWPWSITNSVPSSSFTGTRLCGRPDPLASTCRGLSPSVALTIAGLSDAGKLSLDASSSAPMMLST